MSTLLIKTRDDSTFKRLKRKLTKTPDLDIKTVTPQMNAEKILLHKMKSTPSSKAGYLHVLFDRQTLLHLPRTSQPMQNLPPSWDILCFSSDTLSYDYTDSRNSVFWCKAKVKSSVNFVINPKSFVKCTRVLKKGSLTELFSIIDTFVVTQYAYSEPLSTSPYTCRVNIQPTTLEETPDQPCGNTTFVTVVTDPATKSAASNALYAFSKSNVAHNTELMIVDGCNFEKSIDLSVDSRIKVVKITSKNDEPIPLGYALNAAVKHASYDIIFHLLPENFYFFDNFNRLIHCLAGRPFDMLMAVDSLYYNPADKSSCVALTPSIANCIYLKNFWKVHNFNELENDGIKLLHHFTKGRSSLVRSFPSILSSFTVDNAHHPTDAQSLPLSIPDLLDSDAAKMYAVDTIDAVNAIN